MGRKDFINISNRKYSSLEEPALSNSISIPLKCCILVYWLNFIIVRTANEFMFDYVVKQV